MQYNPPKTCEIVAKYTYVSPFRRTTFYLKKEDNNEDE